MNRPNKVKRKVLYMPSTPLNVLVSVAHALAFSAEQKSQLVLIDQKEVNNNIYYEALKAWKSSPFLGVDLIPGKAQNQDKWAERKANFEKLTELSKAFPADAIAVGSDRRVEFQYLMHARTKQSQDVEGWYLDDGLYSYAGRPFVWYKDIVNSILKKISYGFWWQEPSTVGASHWIKQAWLFSPKNSVMALKNKTNHPIMSQWFLSAETAEFVNLVLDKFEVSKQVRNSLNKTELFVLVPHPNNVLKMTGYQARLEQFLDTASKLGVSVAIKYHPRSKGDDYLNLAKRYQALILPNNLAFEFVMPLLGSKTTVVGDVSTVLMTAKWLRPDIQTFAVLTQEDAFAQKFKGVITKLGITVAPSFDKVLKQFNQT